VLCFSVSTLIQDLDHLGNKLVKHMTAKLSEKVP